MCFSPTASFVASGALAVIGGGTLREARNKKEIPLALIPLLFALQQFTEGVIWLSFGSPHLLKFLTYFYATFSHVLWPFFIPLSVFLIEPSKGRKRLLFGFLVLGVLVSIYILYFIIQWPIEAVIGENILKFGYRAPLKQESIQYIYSSAYPTYTLAAYLIAVTVAPLFSSYRVVKIFGVAVFISAYVAYQSYELSFFSVWCFFSAAMSALIYIHFDTGAKAFPQKVLSKVKEMQTRVKNKLNR